MHEARIRRALRLIARATTLGARTIRVNGRAFVTPKIDGQMCQIAEPWLLDVLRAFLPARAGAFIDVGANLGQSLLAAKAIDPARAYVGFEPNSVCAAYVRALIARNDLTDCAIAPFALAREAGVSKLFLYNENEASPGATLIPDFRKQAASGAIYVAAFPFEAMAQAADVARIGFFKIDVEGGEADVLESMAAAIARDRPMGLIEVLPAYDATNTDRLARQARLEAQVAALDYRLLRVVKGVGDRWAGLTPVAAIGVHADLAACDYLLCPAEAVEAALARAE